MNPSPLNEIAQAREQIERTRAKIAEVVTGIEREHGPSGEPAGAAAQHPPHPRGSERAGASDVSPLTRAFAELQAQFNSHPLAIAARAGQPLLEAAARERPWTVLAVAALGGAAVVVLRPWKLLVGAATASTVVKRIAWAPLVDSLIRGYVMDGHPQKKERQR